MPARVPPWRADAPQGEAARSPLRGRISGMGGIVCYMHISCQVPNAQIWPVGVCNMSTPAERLRRAREAAGYGPAAEGAARAGVKYYPYVQHENGTRGVPADRAETYGRAFAVEPQWILYGRSGRSRAMIP